MPFPDSYLDPPEDPPEFEEDDDLFIEPDEPGIAVDVDFIYDPLKTPVRYL